MLAKFDREEIHKLFLKEKGNIQAVMKYENAPKSPNTIRCYAKDGRWHEELPVNSRYRKRYEKKRISRNSKPKKSAKAKNSADIVDDRLKDINRLERVKRVIYKFLVLSSSEKKDSMRLEPKTYAEAVKCYLDIDSRIEEKKGKSSNSSSVSSPWEEIVRRASSDK